ncbi:MAG: PAS domain S-box protein [Vicinamibacterales bacterium]
MRTDEGSGPLRQTAGTPAPAGPIESIADLVDRELKGHLDHAAECIHWVGSDGVILWANRTELDLLGYSPEEYIGQSITKFHVDQAAIADILERLTRGETLLNYEARLRHKNGSIRDVEINSNVLWREGTFVHTRCFTHDVTDRKAADELAERLSELVEHSDEAIVGKDLEGVVTSWNPAAERMFGYSGVEAIGQSIRLIIPPDRQTEEDNVLFRIRRGERIEPFETVRLCKDGTSIDISVTISPIRNRHGRIVGASKLARDISARRRLQTRDRFLVQLDDAVRPLREAEEITFTAARMLGEHLGVNRCAYATVEDDQDTFVLTGNYTHGVQSIVGRYTFRQFGETCLRLMREGNPYVVVDAQNDTGVTAAERPSYEMTAIRGVICVPILKQARFVGAMAVHTAEARRWRPDEVELVQQVASRCWESIERARVTQNLRESERQFRELANSIANLAWMARPDGWVYWLNEQWYDYTGATQVESEGWGWQRAHDPAVITEVTARWRECLGNGAPFEMVFPLRSATGEFRRFLTRANPVRDSGGRVVQWFGTSTDVEAERRAMEINELLREREQKAREEVELQKRVLHSLFMQAPTLIAVLRGPDHVIELANPPICQVWGRTSEQLINRPLFDAFPELREQTSRPLLEEVYRTGVPYVGRETPTRFDRGHGATDTVYFNFVYSPFRNIDGRIEGIFVIASDVTDQVLARTQVNELREAAETANRAKDEFLAMLGHELRNPLSPILTALQLMKLQGEGSFERARTVIERQVNHLTRLVDDLLDVSRIARGKVELKEELVEISEVVAKAIEMSSPLIEQRAHTLTVNVSRAGLAVVGDPVRLSQVIANLLTNAAKYTPPGGTIVVTAAEEEGDVVVRVRDTGMGISSDVLPRVFDLFVQERQAIDRSQGGLGLGLTIVRNLIEQHRGSVSASSEGPGQGTEFIVRLPRALVADAAVSARVSTIASNEALDVSLGGRRILVVDDNEDSAEMLAAALRSKGHQARVANGAPAALQLAQEFAPHVAFLDIGLPVMDGYELAARLRELPGLGEIRLIALTGYGQASDRQMTSAAGFHHHLVKPVDFAAVQAAVAG